MQDLDGLEDEVLDIVKRLSDLVELFFKRGMESRPRAARVYHELVKRYFYGEGDDVFVWNTELANIEGNKLWKPWVRLYKVKQNLGRVG